MSYFKKIVDKWSHKIDKIEPDLKNKNHIYHLENVLLEEGWTWDVINELIELLEAPNDSQYKHIGYGKYKLVKDVGKEGTPTFKKTDDGKYVELGKEKDTKKEPTQKDKPVDAQMAGDRDAEPGDVVKKEKEPKDKPERQVGQLSDKDDILSDGEIKQKGLDIGFKEEGDFKPAPGNAGSMLAEIMSGEVGSFLDENPDMTDEELVRAIYDHVKDTTLGKQNGDHTRKRNKSGKYEGVNADLMKKCESIAKAGREKHTRMNESVDRLDTEDKISKPVKIRNFYGHETSIQKQVELIEQSDGPFYTNQGVKVPKDVLIDLIKKSGGGENPSDTSTIAIDEQGRGIVTFHSDKLTTADIQANSTPNKESEQAKLVVDDSDMSDEDNQKAKSIIEEGQRKLSEKENELKQAANQPAREMSEGNIDQILDDIKSDKGIDGKAIVSSHLKKSLMSRGKPHPSITPYLEVDEPHSEKDLLIAFYKFAGDDDREKELTESQLKLLYRSAKQNGYDISSDLGKIRKESIEVQRETHSELNKQEVTLPDGTKKPLGDFVEAQNVMDKLHIGVVDGEEGHGVGKYPGLFNLNMGGTIVEAEQLKGCLNVKNSDDFVTHFEVGEPGDGEEEIVNPRTKQVTGRNIFVYAITKEGERIPVAVKTQRSKQGESGKLSTTYQWHKDTQKCFKGKS